MDSNESHQGSRAGLWSDCERIRGFQLILTNLTRGAVQASGRKLLIRSWAPPPGGFPEIGKGSQDSDGFQQITPGGPCGPLVGLGKGSQDSDGYQRISPEEPCKPPYLEASRGVSWIPKDSLKSHAKVAFLVALECSVVSSSKQSNPIIPQARPKEDTPGGSRKEERVNKFPKLYMSIARVHLVNS